MTITTKELERLKGDLRHWNDARAGEDSAADDLANGMATLIAEVERLRALTATPPVEGPLVEQLTAQIRAAFEEYADPIKESVDHIDGLTLNMHIEALADLAAQAAIALFARMVEGEWVALEQMSEHPEILSTPEYRKGLLSGHDHILTRLREGVAVEEVEPVPAKGTLVRAVEEGRLVPGPLLELNEAQLTALFESLRKDVATAIDDAADPFFEPGLTEDAHENLREAQAEAAFWVIVQGGALPGSALPNPTPTARLRAALEPALIQSLMIEAEEKWAKMDDDDERLQWAYDQDTFVADYLSKALAPVEATPEGWRAIEQLQAAGITQHLSVEYSDLGHGDQSNLIGFLVHGDPEDGDYVAIDEDTDPRSDPPSPKLEAIAALINAILPQPPSTREG